MQSSRSVAPITVHEQQDGWTLEYGTSKKVKLGQGTRMSKELITEALRIADTAINDMEMNHPKRYDKVAEALSEHFHRQHGQGAAADENQWQCIVGSRFGSMVESREGDFLTCRIGDYTQIMLYRSKKRK